MPDLAPLAGARASGESDKAVLACNDWLRLGPGRSLPGLVAHYTERHRTAPPARTVAALKQWSARFGWAARATAYDAAQEQAALAREAATAAEEDAARLAHRRTVLETGYASDLARIGALDRLAHFLEAQIYEEQAQRRHRVWLADVKQIGSGESANRVDLERFNGALIAEFRGTLEDLAKETGGRVQKVAPTTPDGTKPYAPGTLLDDLGDLTDAELTALIVQAETAHAGRSGGGGPGGAG